jgi:hypothetical protein
MHEMIQPVILFLTSIIAYKIGVYHRNLKKEVVQETKKTKPLENENTFFEQLFSENNNYSNSNINPELYVFETFQKLTKNESPEEQKWKTRYLFQSTTQGNVAMFYDLYRQAFAYFSDVQISYNILNLCAMKYVRIFLCRDFFVDTTLLPNTFVNPFNTMKEEEIKLEKQKMLEKRKEKKIDFDKSAFVQPKKKYNTKHRDVKNNNKNNSETNNENKTEEPEKEVYKNNFRYMGKLYNFNVLQKYNIPVKKKSKSWSNFEEEYDHVNPESPDGLVSNVKSHYSFWKSLKSKIN